VLLALTALHHGKIGRMARPHGELVQALQAAAGAGPGTVRELAHRGLVGLSVARYTASRMVDRGQLVVVDAGRPAVLALPGTTCTEDVAVGADLVGVLSGWHKA
jgi:hypothetical protein